jgi:acyl carrier protein
MAGQTDVGEVIKGWLRNEFLAGDAAHPIADGDDLLDTGIVDSLGVLRLVSFIEKRFAVRIPDEDVSLENFRTVGDIRKYYDRLTGSA